MVLTRQVFNGQNNATFETKINNGSLNLKVQDEYKDYYDKS